MVKVNVKPSIEEFGIQFKGQYDNFIGGEWVAPVNGEYFDNSTPITKEVFTRVARSTKEDVELALDAAHEAQKTWGKTPVAERARILLAIADRMEENLEKIARVETWDNGKAIRETMYADIPLAIDNFRYFASAIRAQQGQVTPIDGDTVAYHYQEPIGVVGQIIPWNFPILMAAWKLAPALAAGNSVVLKLAEQTPVSFLFVVELIQDLLPKGVLNVINGFGVEAGKELASSPRIGKVAFTGSTAVGKLIMKYASENLIPVTLELGGKSPNIFFEDVMDADDGYLDKAIEGLVMFALNQGEVCTCPSRALIHESIYDRFMEKAIERVKQIKVGNPFELETMMGAQASEEQHKKILSYFEIAKQDGAECLIGGAENHLDNLDGYFIQPTIFKGHNKMRIFQEEIFGPVLAVTTFKTFEEAIEIANDTMYGLGAAVWSRNTNITYKASREIQAGRVWINTYHQYPAGAAFGGYKKSGIGRENHLKALESYQSTKCVLASYNEQAQGFF
ncbi:aldehyde dehydrogenase family protein [Lysinibacillus sp. NPDC095746]|uniref:aldehyde dehydrogenase family protein n=1 Tax=Lysinibacillus sp. NPDC095746 TaxID=3364134 RepID=UPI00380AF726